MSADQGKRSLIKKVTQVGGATFASRMLGLVREVLLVKYLGASALADAFITAYKIPNSLRKIFAEGALSAAFVPTIVSLVKKGDREGVDRLMTLSFLIFEGILILFCWFIFVNAQGVIRFIAPGWFTCEPLDAITGLSLIDPVLKCLPPVWFAKATAHAQVAHVVSYLRILISFIVFLSSSALLTGALQAVDHFFIPAFAPVLLNGVFIGALLICLAYKLSVEYLCYFLLFGGLLSFLLHLAAYFKFNFTFGAINRDAWNNFKKTFAKFVPCMLGMSVMEINLFIDTSLASYLQTGSIALVYYANRFMQIPLGVFAVALATVLLPYFTRVGIEDPKKLRFYLLESTKLIVWVMLPISVLMIFFADQIFSTLFLSSKFTLNHVMEASSILIAFCIGLTFFSLGKILQSIFYALHETRIPAKNAMISTGINIIGDLVLIRWYGAVGLALATTISGIYGTCLAYYMLNKRFNISCDWALFTQFLIKYTAQLGSALVLFWGVYHFCFVLVARLLPMWFSTGIGFWVWVSPLCVGLLAILYSTRRLFGLQLYFFD